MVKCAKSCSFSMPSIPSQATAFREKLKREGKLSDIEAIILTNFEFYHGPVTVDDQVTHYHLKLKSEDVDRAAILWSEVEPYLVGEDNQRKIEAVCLVLSRHRPGFVIRHQKKHYTVSDGKLICL